MLLMKGINHVLNVNKWYNESDKKKKESEKIT